jgi:hypothetical protein
MMHRQNDAYAADIRPQRRIRPRKEKRFQAAADNRLLQSGHVTFLVEPVILTNAWLTIVCRVP